MTHNRPATLTWTPEHGIYVTEYDGTRWILAKTVWHLGESCRDRPDEWTLVRTALRASRQRHRQWWMGPPGRGVHRAQQIAAWIIANPDTAECLTFCQILDAVEASR